MSRRHLRIADPEETHVPAARDHLRGADLDRALAHALDRLAARPSAGEDDGDALVPWSLRRFLA